MSAAASHQATTKATNYSASNIKKPVLIKSATITKPKQKSQANTYSFVGIAG